MKIFITTRTGMGQTYDFNVESSITIKQLKEEFLNKTNDQTDLQRLWFVFTEKIHDYDDNTLSDYHIKDQSILRAIDLYACERSDFPLKGTKFVDVGNTKGLKRIVWSKSSSPWRIARPGLCLESLCTDGQCNASKGRVIMPIGYKKFDVLIDPDETTTKYPACKKYVEPITCSFNNCWWRYKGIQQDGAGQDKAPMKSISDWQQVDDAYHLFDENTSEIVIWKQLIVEAVRNIPNE